MYPVKCDVKSGILFDLQPLCTSMFFLLLSIIFILLLLYKLQVTAVRGVQPTIYEGWNFNSGNYLFTTDTK